MGGQYERNRRTMWTVVSVTMKCGLWKSIKTRNEREREKHLHALRIVSVETLILHEIFFLVFSFSLSLSLSLSYKDGLIIMCSQLEIDLFFLSLCFLSFLSLIFFILLSSFLNEIFSFLSFFDSLHKE